MFTPLELGFGVDATLSVEFLANREARRLAAKRKIDADQIAREEAAGEHGPSVSGAERPLAARELEAVLGVGDRPPLLRSALSLAVAGRSEEELEERVERLRDSYGRVQLHRPLGEQHRLFLASLPATRFPLPEYREHLLPDQLGAMVPARDLPRRLGDRPLHRLHPDRLARADPVRPRRGLPAATARRPACWPAASARARRSSWSWRSGRPSCRARGRSSTSTPRAITASSACPGSPSGSRRSSWRPRSATAACSTRCGSARRRPARTSPTTSWSRSCRRRSSPSGRPSCVSRSPRPPPPAPQAAARCWSACAASGERRRGRGRAGDRGARLAAASPSSASGDAATELAEVGDAAVVSLRIRNLTLPLAGTARCGAARGGAHQPRGAAAAGRLRAATLRHRPRLATRCWRWMRPGR